MTTRVDPQPADFADVRAMNLAVVLRHVRMHGAASRAAIAAATGLNKATVSSLTGHLIEHRLLRETGQTENRIGRPGTTLALDGSAYAAVGLEVTAGLLTAVAVDFAADQLLLWHRAFDGRGLESVVALTQRAVARVRQLGRQVLGLTIAVPGLVDEAGTVLRSPALGWSGVDLGGRLAGALRSPDMLVTVRNRADLAALAEQRLGGHERSANLTYVTAAGGIEAGLIVDGRLLRGGCGFTGQLGEWPHEPADADDLVTLARAGDAATLAALHATGAELGRRLAALTNLVNPELIVLGDQLATLAEWLIPPAEAELARHTLAPGAGGARLVPSALASRAAALGGAVSHFELLDAGRLPAQRISAR